MGYDIIGDLWVQHVNAQGQRTWGDSGVVVCDAPGGQGNPVLTHDGRGGAYIVWQDQRPPYQMSIAGFMQRLDPQGNPLWAHNGVFIGTSALDNQVLSDGRGGFYLHTSMGSGADANTL